MNMMFKRVRGTKNKMSDKFPLCWRCSITGAKCFYDSDDPSDNRICIRTEW